MAKTRAYKNLLDSVDEDTWGFAYKLVRNKLQKRDVSPSDPDVLANIVAELFPMQSTSWQPIVATPVSDFPNITEHEVVEASRLTKPLD